MTDLPAWLDQWLTIAMLGGSGYCFLRGASRLLRTNPELAWRQVPGQIVSSEVERGDEANSAAIRYRYVVDGDHFDGKKIAALCLLLCGVFLAMFAWLWWIQAQEAGA